MAHTALFILQLLLLWLSLGSLAVITAMALVASSTRSDCTLVVPLIPSITNITVASTKCALKENISAVVYHHLSYFQSAHITFIRAIATFSLLVFQPSLLAMAWSALESSVRSTTGVQEPAMKMSAFEHAFGLVNSPALIPSVLYTKASRSVTPHVTFVLVVSVLSLLSPIAVSPVYRSHQGAYNVTASVVNGGGVGPTPSPSFNFGDIVPGGIVAGRAYVNAAAITNNSIKPATFNISVIPFIPRNSIQATWNMQIETVAARNSYDCGPSALMRLSNSSQDIVIIPPSYFGSNQSSETASPSFANISLGFIPNDPQVAIVYLNSNVTTGPGSVEAQTSIIFLAVNGTIEGAQQTITSPDPTSRIESVDVLVCTSTTRLETSTCTINRGAVVSCNSYQPANSSANSTGVDKYIKNPLSVAMYLSASAVTAYYNLDNRLPMYDLSQAVINAQIPPLPYMDIESNVGVNYNIPHNYVIDVLFGQTAQGLVQGMVAKWQASVQQEVSLIATFGTSKPVLLWAIMGISLLWALIATLAGTLPRSAQCAAELNVSRLLAISRNPQLDTLLQPYSDWNVKMEEEVLNARVGYQLVKGLNRRALVIEPGQHGGGKAAEHQTTSETLLPVVSQMHGEVIGFDGPIHDNGEQR
jgi:hypothetical protein